MKYYILLSKDDTRIGMRQIDQLIAFFSELKIKPVLQKSLKDRIVSEVDFEITVDELKELVPVLEEKIEQLLKHPDFNPFKENLRKKFPAQYESEPFNYKGTIYYLYSKGREFQIDRDLYNISEFKRRIEKHIEAGKSLKYILKETAAD